MAKARRKWQAKKPASRNGARKTATKKYQAPMLNYKDFVFSVGTEKYVTLFQDVVIKISLCVRTQNWKRSTVLLKAMEDLENPVFVEPVRPVRQYMTVSGGERVQTTARMNADIDLNTLMVNDIDYQADMTVYLSKMKRYDDQELEWEDLNAKDYSLVLQNFPP